MATLWIRTGRPTSMFEAVSSLNLKDGRAVRRVTAGGVVWTPGFDINSLFANGEDGVVLAPGDTSLTALFTERTGASATTVAGEDDPVGTFHDLVNDRYFVAPSDADRATLKKDGSGYWYLLGSGNAAPYLEGTVSFPASGMSFGVAARYLSSHDAQGSVFHIHDGNSASGVRGVRLNDPDLPGVDDLVDGVFDSSGLVALTYFVDFVTSKLGTDFVTTAFYSDSVQKGWYNGVLKFDETNALVSMDTTDIMFGDDFSGGDDEPHRLYGIVMIDREWKSDTERQNVQNYLAGLYGGSL